MPKPGEPDEGLDSLLDRALKGAVADEAATRRAIQTGGPPSVSFPRAGGAAPSGPPSVSFPRPGGQAQAAQAVTGPIRFAPAQQAAAPAQASPPPTPQARPDGDPAAFVELLPLGVLLSDAAGVVRATNGVARRIWGVGEAVLEGRRVIDLFDPSDRGTMAQILDDAFRGRASRELPLNAVGPAGSFPLSVAAAGRLDAERRLRQVIWTLREPVASPTAVEVHVHGSKVEVLAEVGLELGRELGQVIVRMTDAIVTAQRVLSPSADEVKGPEREVIKGRLADATSGLLRLQEIVAELERFAATPPLKLEPVDPAIVLARAQTLLARPLKATRVRVRNEMDEPPPRVLADGSRLTEIFVNLFRNARNAIARRFDGQDADAATGVKRLIVVESFVKDPYVCLVVSNNGLPVSPADAERIFLPSFQTKDAERSGLGLPETAALMKQMGGAISCDSLGEAGTRFILTLPRAS